MRSVAAFSDPRNRNDRRSSISRHMKLKDERKIKRTDRRSYDQHVADKPWSLIRGYVTAEKFVVNP